MHGANAVGDVRKESIASNQTSFIERKTTVSELNTEQVRREFSKGSTQERMQCREEVTPPQSTPRSVCAIGQSKLQSLQLVPVESSASAVLMKEQNRLIEPCRKTPPESIHNQAVANFWLGIVGVCRVIGAIIADKG